METLRKFVVQKPAFTEQDFEELSTAHDGKRLELFYNLIMAADGLSLPDHLRPVAHAFADNNIHKCMIIISPGAGKSQFSNIVYPLWELGLDINQTILAVSAAEGLMITFLQAAMNLVEHSTTFQSIFPRATPDKATGWSAFRGIYLRRGVSALAPPSYSVAGYESRAIIGKHATRLILDDIHDENNSGSNDQINKVEDWYYRTLLGRQDPKGSRLMMIGRRWAADDLYGRLRKSGDWLVMQLPSIREDTRELYYECRIPAGMSCVFNDYKASSLVEDIKVIYGSDIHGFYWPDQPSKYREAIEVRKNKPSLFETVYQSRPERGGDRLFIEKDFRFYNPPVDLIYGRNFNLETASFCDRFEFILQSWDTAFTSEKSSDPSCCYCIGLKPCTEDHRSLVTKAGVDREDEGEVPFHYDIYVLDEFHAVIDFGDLLNEAVAFFNKWQPNLPVLIEKSAVGEPLIQSLTQYSIPVEGVVVQHSSKRSRIINGAKAGSAQGWFRQGRVVFPQGIDWTDHLKAELLEFVGSRYDRDDRVDALVHAINYAIDMGIKSREFPPGWRSESSFNDRIKDSLEVKHPFSQLAKAQEMSANPFEGTCGTCKSYKDDFCKLHNHTVCSLNSCQMFESKTSSAPTAFKLYN